MQKKIRILQCIRQGQIGGGESHLLSLVENLDKLIFEPIVLSFTAGPMVDRLQDSGIKCYIIPTLRPFDITKWKEVKRLLINERIELVHAHGTRANSNVLWAAKSLNIPVIYTVHGWSFHNDQPFMLKTLRILGEKYLTSQSNINISVSESNKKTGQKYLRKFDSEVVNNGIDLQKFSAREELSDIRQELKIPSDVILILFIARFTHQKQPLQLLKAFERAVSEYPKMHLLMVGEGELKQKALDSIEERTIASKVTFLPFRQDVPELLSAGDIFVLPSLWEGLPIGLLEAMSMGKAIIATNVDGTSEVINHQQNGLLVEVGDCEDLSKSIVRLANDTELRVRLQKQSLLTIKEKFNAATMAIQIENIYKSLLHGI